MINQQQENKERKNILKSVDYSKFFEMKRIVRFFERAMNFIYK